MQSATDQSVCPFFEGKDRRCARRFNLQRISKVYEQCLDQYCECAIFQDLTVGETDRSHNDVRAA